MATSAALGVIVGLVLALTGAGGAILGVPLLLFVLRLSVAEAAPISLLAVCLAAAVGAVLGLRAGIVRYRAAMLMSVTGMMISPLGLWLAHRLPNPPLMLIFAVVLAWVAWRMFTRSARPSAHPEADAEPLPPCLLNDVSGRLVWTAPCVRVLTLSGLSAGFLSGLLGVGGGFVIVPLLGKFTNAPIHAIVATSLAVIALVSAFGVFTATLAGHMNWPVGLPFAIGAMIAMLAGQPLANRLHAQRLQQGIALIFGVVAISMATKAIMAGI